MPSKKVLNNMDIYCPNFDHFLQLKLENITPEQTARLEDGVQYKIFHYKTRAIEYMSWAEKLHLCSIAFDAPVVLCVANENDGISPKLFSQSLKAQAAKIKNSELLDSLRKESVFVLSDMQVMQSMLYMNHVETTDIYNLFRMNDPRGKSKKELAFSKQQEVLKGVVGKFLFYERHKKKVLMQYKLSLAKWYGLLYFYDGEKLCKDFYDKAFKYSYIGSRTELSRSLAELCREGYLNKRGTTRELKYSITSKGVDILLKILNKLLYDI